MRLYRLAAFALCSLILCIGSLTVARAATLDFFIGGTQPWDYTTKNWEPMTAGPVAWIDGSDARFVRESGTVTFSVAINSVNSITFVNSNYLLLGGTITLTGTGGAIDTQSCCTNINSVISGSVGLSKSGSGVLTLSGANDYTGNTNILQGTLNLADANALQNSTLDYNSYGGNLRFGWITNATFGGLMGNGTLTLINDSLAPVALTVGGNNQSTIYDGTIDGPAGASLKKVGSGILTLSSTVDCDTIISEGTLQVGSNDALRNSTVEMAGGSLNYSAGPYPYITLGGLKGTGNLALSGHDLFVGRNGQSTTYAGVLSGTMGLNKEGSGTLTLTGENLHTGYSGIASGMLCLGTAKALQNSTLYHSSYGGGVLSFGTLVEATVGGLTGNGTLTLINASLAPVALTVGGNNQSTIYDGTINGPTGASLNKVGSGILTLSSTVDCDTIISEGTLQVGSSDALRNSTVEMAGGSLNYSAGPYPYITLGGLKGTGNLALSGHDLFVGRNGQSTTYAGVLSGTMGLNKEGSGTLTLTGENLHTGYSGIASGMLCLGTAKALQNSTLYHSSYGGGVLSFGTLVEATVGGLTGNGTLTLINASLAPVALTVGGNNQSTIYDGTINGPTGASLNKVGSGILTLSSTVDCDTIISEGTLQVGSSDALRNSTVEMAGGSLNYSAGPYPYITLGGLKGTGNLALSGHDLFVGRNGQSTTYAGVLSGTMGLNKEGSGTLTLTGENLHTGYSGIASGMLCLGTAKALQNSTLYYGNYGGGVLSFGTLSEATFGGLIGNGTLTLINDSLAPVALTVGGNNQSTIYDGTIDGPAGASLKKVGSGILTLSSTIDCDTIISEGTLQLGSNDALRNSTVEMAGGSLNYYSAGPYPYITLGGLKGTGNLSLSGNDLFVGRNGQSTTYAGALSGMMGLNKEGSGILTLTGENLHTGYTRISSGMLRLGTAKALQNSTLYYGNYGGGVLSFGTLSEATFGGLIGNGTLTLVNDSLAPVALTVGGNNQSTIYDGTIDGPAGASLKKVGSGILTLNGGINCDTILSGGTLQLGANDALRNSTVEMAGGSLNYYSAGPYPYITLGGLKGTGNLSLSGNDLFVGRNGQSTTYAGVLSGTMGLIKDGSGTLTLTGENLHTGYTGIASGMLRLGNTKALQNSTLYHSSYGGGVLSFGTLVEATVGGLTGNGTLTLINDSLAPVALTIGGNNQSTIYDGTINGPTGASLNKVGFGILTLSSTVDCDTIISEGTLQVGSNDALRNSTVEMAGGSFNCSAGPYPYITLGGLKGTGNLSLSGNDLFVGRNGQSTTYAGVLSGTMGLIKDGSGTLTLTGENLHTGYTGIASGMLRLGNTKALQNSTLYHSSYGGGVLSFGTLVEATVGGLTGNGTLTLINDSLAPVALTVGGNNESTIYDGTINGPTGASLRKVGSGTLTLSGYNGYTGATVVAGGQLTLLPAACNAVLNLGGADVQNGKLVFDYEGTSANPATMVASLMAASYRDGLWDIGQFRSSTAAVMGLTLGWFDNGAGRVTVMATYPGDFNLDGNVNDCDLGVWKSHIGIEGDGSTWQFGDANYDGSVDGLDLDIWKSHRGSTLAVDPSGSNGGFVALPEPSTLTLLALGLLTTIAYTRGRRR